MLSCVNPDFYVNKCWDFCETPSPHLVSTTKCQVFCDNVSNFDNIIKQTANIFSAGPILNSARNDNSFYNILHYDCDSF